jgi:hypothetical protein
MKLKRINLTSNAENKALWDLLKGSIDPLQKLEYNNRIFLP